MVKSLTYIAAWQSAAYFRQAIGICSKAEIPSAAAKAPAGQGWLVAGPGWLVRSCSNTEKAEGLGDNKVLSQQANPQCDRINKLKPRITNLKKAQTFLGGIDKLARVHMDLMLPRLDLKFLSKPELWLFLSYLTSAPVQLDLRKTKMDDYLLKTLVKRCPNLHTLNLSACPQLTVKGYAALSTLQGLHSLDVSCNNIGERAGQAVPSITQIAKLRALKELNLAANAIGKNPGEAVPSMNQIAKWSALEKLDLSNNRIGQRRAGDIVPSMIQIAKLEGLKKLNLADNLSHEHPREARRVRATLGKRQGLTTNYY